MIRAGSVHVLTCSRLFDPRREYSLAHTDQISQLIKEGKVEKLASDAHASSSRSPAISTGDNNTSSNASAPSLGSSQIVAANSENPEGDKINLLSRELSRAYLLNRLDEDESQASDTSDEPDGTSSSSSIGSNEITSLLFYACEDDEDGTRQVDTANDRIQHAPLIDAEIISDSHDRLPQYGLLGLHSEAEDSDSKLYLNTNVPFSMFICGVQGSGKSHTTSCVLENALIPSRHLGKLPSPLSALVFSYAQFSGDGIGFTVSEAAFLASPDQRLPGGAHVKRVHVLVSPSNFVRISKLYSQLPNVLVTPFKLMPRDLDIGTILTLMNVSKLSETPLYMAQVTQVLREMSTSGEPFDYLRFKGQLTKKDFNAGQASMLQLRLDLLESFLELDASHVEPHFQFGEVTIMDMSCPFIDANTACILFRIGLELYLQSKGNGKMIVLDEAHKVWNPYSL